jgi:tRNA-intron endonuclease
MIFEIPGPSLKRHLAFSKAEIKEVIFLECLAPLYPDETYNLSVKAKFDGTSVRLDSAGCSLYEQSGYGRPEHGGLRLSPEETCYLLHRNRIEVEGFDFDGLLSHFAVTPGFLRRFLVYRDLRERGYAVQTGPHDFRVFRRGERPGTGQSQYMVRVLSERDLISFGTLIRETTTSERMRKQHILAIVDDESELTYYEIKLQDLPMATEIPDLVPVEAILVGHSAIIHPSSPLKDQIPSLGMNLDSERMLLSPLEILYLMTGRNLILWKDGTKIDIEEFFTLVAEQDQELAPKSAVYRDLRERGYIPRTGYKFGHHFRVYTGKKLHSELLVHAIAAGVQPPMSNISRSVRLAHSVKKKMLFALQNTTGIQYVEFARIKL